MAPSDLHDSTARKNLSFVLLLTSLRHWSSDSISILACTRTRIKIRYRQFSFNGSAGYSGWPVWFNRVTRNFEHVVRKNLPRFKILRSVSLPLPKMKPKTPALQNFRNTDTQILDHSQGKAAPSQWEFNCRISLRLQLQNVAYLSQSIRLGCDRIILYSRWRLKVWSLKFEVSKKTLLIKDVTLSQPETIIWHRGNLQLGNVWNPGKAAL